MKHVISKTGIAGLAVALLAGVASAQGPGRPGGRGPGGEGGRPGFGGERAAERLGLSDEQKAQWRELQDKQRETLRPLFDVARQAHEAFRTALEAANPDALAVGKAALAMHAADKEVREARQAAFEDLKTILTPEQREKLEQSRERGPRRPNEHS